jgi:hypothetical protein
MVIADYRLALSLGVVWLLVASIRRIFRPKGLSSAQSGTWAIPIAAWALQAAGAALTSTQLDLVAGYSRIPIMWMYAASSGLAGLCVMGACFAAMLVGSREPRDSARRGPIIVSAAAWATTAAVWGAVLVREATYIEGR